MPASKKRQIEVEQFVSAYGRKAAMENFGITEETLGRYLRRAKTIRGEEPIQLSGIMAEIADRYTPQELKAIAKGGRIIPGAAPVPVVDFEGRHIRIGAMTDTHIGHTRSSRQRIEQAFEEFHKNSVDIVTHSGDVTEGMSHRPGQIYELDFLGYDQQKQESIDIFSQWTNTPIYAVDGNHDRWYIKSNGAIIVKDIALELDNFHFVGHDEGDISLDGRATIKLFHGEDGNSYSLSYRLQKIIESLSGGEKPNVMLCGHTHKYVHIFERNIHTLSVGCMQGQTSWMRSKRIAAHVGFCIVDIWLGRDGVTKLRNTWYPFYA